MRTSRKAAILQQGVKQADNYSKFLMYKLDKAEEMVVRALKGHE